MTRDIKLDYDQAGQGAPPLVFVHGFAGGREQWRPQAGHFDRTNRVICLDLRGHGASARGTEELTMQTLAADVVGLLEELELSGAVLAGHSMGCRIVLEARRQAPGRIAGVVLVDGSNIGFGDKEGALARIEGEIAEKGYEDFARKLFEDMFVEGYDSALKEQVMTRARALPEETGHPLFKGIVAYDADDAVMAYFSSRENAIKWQRQPATDYRKQTKHDQGSAHQPARLFIGFGLSLSKKHREYQLEAIQGGNKST